MIELDSGRGICYNVIASHGNADFAFLYAGLRDSYHNNLSEVECRLRPFSYPLAVRSSVTTGRANFV
jgi:hypothetical protein